MKFKKLKINIGKLNKIEKIYIVLFLSSILIGVLYGIFNKNYFKGYEETLEMEKGKTGLTFFSKILFCLYLVC